MEKVVTAGQIPEKYEEAKFRSLFRRVEYAINSLINDHKNTVVTATTSYRATTGDFVILGDSSASVVTVTLPPASEAIYKRFDIKKIDVGANVVVIATAAGDIDGGTTKSLSVQYQALTLVSDGQKYWVI